ncbi:hypothetical protein ALC56_10094 [Trachymyrmex septentrionalis]|uniref:Uncharacterized protein n=1 Tax=Trachymyrmex septentrionalis TaxID=34720 RepID=A0A195F5T2_9HYME|nr:hypothetical protein ALC56_10094 [Trachymyrmex septentrionalis]
MDPMDSGRRRKPSARLSCTGWSTSWKRLRRDERTSGTRTETVGRMADHPRRRFRGPPTSGGGDTIGNGEGEVVVGRSDGGSEVILSNIRLSCDKIIIPAIPGGRDDVPSGT